MKLKKQIFIFTLSLFIVVQHVSSEELVIVSPHWEGFRREFEWGFLRWMKKYFPKNDDVTIRWLDIGGASDIAKTLSARKAVGEPLDVDVLFGGGVDSFETLKKKGLLSKYIPNKVVTDEIPDSIMGNPLKDAEGYWYGVNVTSFGFGINRELLKRLKFLEPESFVSLTSDQYKGLIGSADPRKSGSVRFLYELVLQRYGWEKGWKLLYQITSNIRSFNNNSSQSPKDLTTGEIAVALIIDSYGIDVERRYGSERIKFVIPNDVQSYFADPVAIGADGKHRFLSERFIDFCISTEGQDLLLAKVGSNNGPKQFLIGRLPVVKNIYQQTPPSERARIEEPFSELSGSFVYNAELAQKRWGIVTKLLGAILVDKKDDLVNARYKLHLDLTALPPPTSEEKVVVLQKQLSQGSPEAVADVERKILQFRNAFLP